MMVEVVRVTATGGPDVMQLTRVEQQIVGEDDARVEHDAIGVNYLDVMQRNGAAPISLPSGLGLEGAGRVAAIGSRVATVAVGDRVAYALGPLGSYAAARCYPAERLIRLSDAVSSDEAAATLFKGLTAQYLIKTTYPVTRGTVVLLYGAAGGVGQILASWANHLDAEVIGVVSKPESIDRARAAGCRHVLVWNRHLADEVDQVTRGRMVDVVFDGVGRETFDASIASLRPRGMMVSIGASTGLPGPVSISTLNAKSLFLTRPSLAAHAGSTEEYKCRAAEVFDALERGIIRAPAWRTFALRDAAAAHTALERGEAGGAIVLKP